MASQDRQAKSYLSLCAIYRDEARYMREWLEFHRLFGVERFFRTTTAAATLTARCSLPISRTGSSS